MKNPRCAVSGHDGFGTTSRILLWWVGSSQGRVIVAVASSVVGSRVWAVPCSKWCHVTGACPSCELPGRGVIVEEVLASGALVLRHSLPRDESPESPDRD